MATDRQILHLKTMAAARARTTPIVPKHHAAPCDNQETRAKIEMVEANAKWAKAMAKEKRL